MDVSGLAEQTEGKIADLRLILELHSIYGI